MPRKKPTAKHREFGEVFIDFVKAAHEYMVHPDTPESGAYSVKVLMTSIALQLSKEELRQPMPPAILEIKRPGRKRERNPRVTWPSELDV